VDIIEKEYNTLFTESIPTYLYRITNNKDAILKMIQTGVYKINDKFVSLTKDWKGIVYNEDFELIYGYTLSNMWVIKFVASELRKHNNLIEIEYTKQWMNSHKDIRNYVFGYIKDFDSENWVDDLSGLEESEQEVVVKGSLKIDQSCVRGIYAPLRKGCILFV
jgi:hypothetical protein